MLNLSLSNNCLVCFSYNPYERFCSAIKKSFFFFFFVGLKSFQVKETVLFMLFVLITLPRGLSQHLSFLEYWRQREKNGTLPFFETLTTEKGFYKLPLPAT